MLEQLRNWVSQQSSLTTTQKNEVIALLKNNSQPNQLQIVNNALTKVFAEQSQQAIFQKI